MVLQGKNGKSDLYNALLHLTKKLSGNTNLRACEMKFAFIVYINPLDSYAHGFVTIKPVTKVNTAKFTL